MAEKNYTVFVVDDDDSVRRSLIRLLKLNGYEVSTFKSAEELLHVTLQASVGCLILDIQLPGMNGLALHERLVASGVNYPVIFITAHENPEWQERARKASRIAYLMKPFDQQALLEAVLRAELLA